MKRELTIKDVLSMLLAHVKLIVIVSVLAGLLSFCYSQFLVTPLYSASALLYVSNSDTVVASMGELETVPTEGTKTEESRKISGADFSSSEKIAATCTVLFKTDIMMNKIIADIGGGYTSSQLKGLINLSSVNETQALNITVTSSNPEDAAKIANSFAKNANAVYRYFIPAGGVRVIEEANVPGAPISPDVKKGALVGFFAGLVLSMLIALFIEIIDTTVKSEDDLYKMYGIPVFAEILDYEGEGKG